MPRRKDCYPMDWTWGHLHTVVTQLLSTALLSLATLWRGYGVMKPSNPVHVQIPESRNCHYSILQAASISHALWLPDHRMWQK
jgi:hypothetical protein